jgi:hypothetical protein
VTFNIGSQQAGIVNNVAGDQTITGGQTTGAVDIRRARDQVLELRRQVELAGLPEPVRSSAVDELDGMEGDLAKPEPDVHSLARRLQRITELVLSAGALASAGTALGTPLLALSGLLGVLGEPIRRLLKG